MVVTSRQITLHTCRRTLISELSVLNSCRIASYKQQFAILLFGSIQLNTNHNMNHSKYWLLPQSRKYSFHSCRCGHTLTAHTHAHARTRARARARARARTCTRTRTHTHTHTFNGSFFRNQTTICSALTADSPQSNQLTSHLTAGSTTSHRNISE